jgi:hypothetical protein
MCLWLEDKRLLEITTNSSSGASITLISKPSKAATTKTYKPTSLMNIDSEFLNKNLKTEFNTLKIIHNDQVNFIPGYKDTST